MDFIINQIYWVGNYFVNATYWQNPESLSCQPNISRRSYILARDDECISAFSRNKSPTIPEHSRIIGKLRGGIEDLGIN